MSDLPPRRARTRAHGRRRRQGRVTRPSRRGRGARAHGARDAGADRRRGGAQGRRHRRGAPRRHHGRQADARADPAVPPAGPERRRASRSRPTRRCPACASRPRRGCAASTGVEMEALDGRRRRRRSRSTTCARRSTAAWRSTQVRLLEKSGGRSGDVAPRGRPRETPKDGLARQRRCVVRQRRRREGRAQDAEAAIALARRARRRGRRPRRPLAPAGEPARRGERSTRCAPRGWTWRPATSPRTSPPRASIVYRCPSARACALGEALLEVTQIGKVCHDRCAIYYQAGDCVMPREGIFVRVLEGGEVKPGRRHRAGEALADPRRRADRLGPGLAGEREDESGAALEELLAELGAAVVERAIVPDERAQIAAAAHATSPTRPTPTSSSPPAAPGSPRAT